MPAPPGTPARRSRCSTGSGGTALTRTVGEAGARTYAEMNRCGVRLRAGNAGAGASLERRDAVTWTEDPRQQATFERGGRAARGGRRPAARSTSPPSCPSRSPPPSGSTTRPRSTRGPTCSASPPRSRRPPAARCTSRPWPPTSGTATSPVVRTARGEVTGEHVVVATGLPFLDRSLFFARTEPYRSYVVAGRTTGTAADGDVRQRRLPHPLAADRPRRRRRRAGCSSAATATSPRTDRTSASTSRR